jgi:hypothetical protein
MKDMSEVYLHRDKQFFHRSIHPRGSNTPSPDDVLVFFSNSLETFNSLIIQCTLRHGINIMVRSSACLHDADGLITPYDSDFSH